MGVITGNGQASRDFHVTDNHFETIPVSHDEQKREPWSSKMDDAHGHRFLGRADHDSS